MQSGGPQSTIQRICSDSRGYDVVWAAAVNKTHFIFRSHIYLRYFLSQYLTHICSQDYGSASTHTTSFVHPGSLSATNKTYSIGKTRKIFVRLAFI
jgi:hypothetical protein